MDTRILRAFIAESQPSPADFFHGNVRRQDLTLGESEVEFVSVWFEAGGRTNIHRHPTEQVLIVTEGEIAAAIGSDRFLLQVGEMIVVPKDRWHWHGATPYRSGCHLSIKANPAAGEWNDGPPAEQAEFDAYDDWDGWLEGLRSQIRR